MGFADEAAKGFAGFVGAQAVQVDLALDAPAALAKLAHHVRPEARAAEAQHLVGVQQGLDVELVGQRLSHHRGLVKLALHGQRLHRHRAPLDAAGVGDGLNRTHGAGEQAVLAFAPQPGLARGFALNGFGRRTLCHGAFERLQIGQRVDFHGAIVTERSRPALRAQDQPCSVRSSPFRPWTRRGCGSR
ncbi:hypothetical protein FQZ97_1048980 [compost metagenome]